MATETKKTKKTSSSSAAKKAKASKAASPAKSAPKKSPKKAAPAKARAAGVGEATLKFVRISPQKARLALNLIKGRQVAMAIDSLRFTPKKSTKLVLKVLQSAISNAREHSGADVDKLWVVDGWVNMGRSIRRFMPRARGSATPIIKRSSHITVRVAER